MQDRRVGIGGQAFEDLIYFGLHFVISDIDVFIQSEGNADTGNARGRSRLDVFDTWGGVDGRFNDTGDAGVDHIGIRTTQSRVDHDDREINGRHPVHADFLVGNNAEQHYDRRQHPRKDVALDREFRQGHGYLFTFWLMLAGLGVASLIKAWSVKKPAPSTTTASFSFRPCRISTRPFCLAPVLTMAW